MLINKIYLTDTDPTQLVSSNIECVNAYFALHIEPDEMLPAILYSYYVDYYLSQVLNGGIAQFAYNTAWRSGTLHYVEFGLHEMGANEHLQLLEDIAELIIGQIGIDNFIQFTGENLLGDNAIRDKLNELTEKFLKINQYENLEHINNIFLKNHSYSVFISFSEFQQVLQTLKHHPLLKDRQQQHLAELPSHLRYIHQLCEQYGCEVLSVLDKENDSDNWHFFTNRGRFFIQETADKVVMMTYRNPEIVAEISK